MDYSRIRGRARQSLQDGWAIAIAIAAMACLLGGLMTGTSFIPRFEAEVSLDALPLVGQLQEFLQKGLPMGDLRISIPSGIPGIVVFLLGGTIQLGYADILLKQHDGLQFRFEDLFSQFHRFGQGFAQQFLRSLYTFLWTLCLIIPGIIASYSYAMTPFIMAENPDLSASEAIERSKAMMDGYKSELFILDLTFIGWSFLAAITANIGYLALNPYTNAARAAFYRQLQAQNRTCIDAEYTHM